MIDLGFLDKQKSAALEEIDAPPRFDSIPNDKTLRAALNRASIQPYLQGCESQSDIDYILKYHSDATWYYQTKNKNL